MIPEMDNDLSKLRNILLKNFAVLQNDIQNFLEGNNILLNVYLENVTTNEQRSAFKTYRNYLTGLFGTLVKTTDFIKEMMLEAQNTIEFVDTDTKIVSKSHEFRTCETTSITSESTVTGNRNGFSYIKEIPLTQPNNKNTIPSKQSNDFSSVNGLYEKPYLPYGKVDISNLQSGSIIPNANVASVQLDKLCFHICLPNPRDLDLLFRLYNAKDRTPYQSPPIAGIVFGMKVDESIVRAIRCLPVGAGKVFLLDFGDIVDVDKNVKHIYHLTKEEQNIPAQAILCKLHCPNGLTKSEMDHQRERLNKLLYQHASFRVIKNNDGILELEVHDGILPSSTDNEDLAARAMSPSSSISSYEEKRNSNKANQLSLRESERLKDEPACTSKALMAFQQHSAPGKISATVSKNRYEENRSSTELNQLNLEELEELNEEPDCTSNALMAVVGYVPKDDQRICRFYDPKIDGCFKGNSCRQLHVPLRKDYVSKDIIPANVYAAIPSMASVRYEENQVLKVTVTHIKNLEYFYGIILNTSMSVAPYIWNNHEVPESDYLKKVPLMYDIVLAKFNDGLWYRAQVIDVDESKKGVEIFYLDYGNVQLVPITNLARCSPIAAKMPAQAQQFRLADIRRIPEKKEAQLMGMGKLCDMILNNDVNVTVVSHYEDLVVRFSDKPLSEIPYLLADMNCVELIEMLVV